MKTKIFLPVLILALFAPLAQAGAKEQPDPLLPDLPEQAGIYDVSGHPGLKLRVFVHHAKIDKAGRTGPTTPQLICNPSTTADPDSSAIVSPAGWKLPSGWTYNLNTASLPNTISSINLATIAANSFASWQAQIAGKVAVTKGANTSVAKAMRDNKNIIAWGRTSGSALAVSYIWYQNGQALEIDTIFNNRFTWYWSDPSTWQSGQTCAYAGVYDVQDILTHELGHTFGMDDMYTADYAHSTMYGYGGTGETKKNTLTTGDIAGLTPIYP